LIFEQTGATMGDFSYITYNRNFVLRGHKRTPELA